jgi:hypothetical protein
VWLDDRGSEVLGRPECLRLLALHAGGIGRLGVVVDRTPVVLPVNYVLVDGEDVAFRSAPGTKLHAALGNQALAFEVDGVDRRQAVAWSVLVQGFATVLDTEELDELDRRTREASLVPAEGTRVVRLRSDALSGRRFAVPPERVEALIEICAR